MLSHRYIVDGHPADVLAAHRDDLPSFAIRLPGVASATEVERQTLVRDGRRLEHLVHDWSGDVARLPGAVQTFITPERFRWIDRSTWDLQRGRVDWTLNAPYLGDGPHLKGWHTFTARPDGTTEVEVQAEVLIEKDLRVAGVPVGALIRGILVRFVQGLFARVVEHTGVALTAERADRAA
jgi:hypothetical protein